jgi:hypothetical protein
MYGRLIYARTGSISFSSDKESKKGNNGKKGKK